MKLELKAIKHIANLSEETHCYSGTIYADGKRVALIQNSGHGAPDEIEILQAAGFKKVMDHFEENKITYPADKYIKEPWTISAEDTLEHWASDQVNEHLQKKELKSYLRKYLLGKLGDDPDLVYWEKKKRNAFQLQHFRAAILKHKGSTPVTFLNDLPFDEAFKLFKI